MRLLAVLVLLGGALGAQTLVPGFSGGGGGSSGVITGCGLSGTTTVIATEAVNAQTGTTYTYLTGDCGKLVTHTNAAAIAGTLPVASASFPAGWFMDVQNRGVGTLTVTPTTSTIDGVATLVLTTGQGARIVSDGTNYFTVRGVGGSVFTGSTASAPAHSATPTFSLADVSGKSPVRFEPGAMTANVTSVTFTNKTAGAKFSIAWPQDGTGTRAVTYGASASNTCTVDPAANVTTTQFFEVGQDGSTVNGVGCVTDGTSITTATNCASGADPAVCTAAASGSVAVATGVNPTLVVNTSVVTANSVIVLTVDSGIGSGGSGKLSTTTCNTTVPALYRVSARTAGTSFTIAITATVATNPVCFNYLVIN